MHKNILIVVGITILFLGISINPAIAINPISSDNKEDCRICQPVSNLQVIEKYKELSDRITTLTEINKKNVSVLSWSFQIICGILFLLAFVFVEISLEGIGLFIAILGETIGCWEISW